MKKIRSIMLTIFRTTKKGFISNIPIINKFWYELCRKMYPDRFRYDSNYTSTILFSNNISVSRIITKVKFYLTKITVMSIFSTRE